MAQERMLPRLTVALLLFMASLATKVTSFDPCTGGIVAFIPHPDDDLLFQSPDLIHDIRGSRCLTSVYFTSGDDGQQNQTYSLSREAGSEAAFAREAKVSNEWTTEYAQMAGKNVTVRTLATVPRIRKLWLHLPQSTAFGDGYPSSHDESILKLYTKQIDVIHALDGSASYTFDEFAGLIQSIINTTEPAVVRAMDFNNVFPTTTNLNYDHSDHLASARFVRDVVKQMALMDSLIGFGGCPISDVPTMDITSQDYHAKVDAFFTYAPYDKEIPCQSIAECERISQGAAPGTPGDAASYYLEWLQRQYYIAKN